MKNPWKSVLALWAIGMGLGVSAPAQAASGVGPYYAMPAWDQKLACATPADCPRFIVLSNFFFPPGDIIVGGAAVLDRETGLVWERSPETRTRTWFDASFACLQKAVGGRKGWRLPSIVELTSLIDPSVASPPGLALPPGHPFLNVQSFPGYWSATTTAADPTRALGVSFGGIPDISGGFVGATAKISDVHAWCVRGPMQESVY